MLGQDLALLEARGLVRLSSEAGRPVLRFKHALTREATYQSILHARRARLHRDVAGTLETLYPDRDFDMLFAIADHWQRGGDDARSLQTLLPRARDLIFSGRASSLIELLARLDVENLAPDRQRERDLALAEGYSARGEYDQARALHERVLPLVDTPELRARVLHGLGVADYHLGNYERAIANQQASLQAATEHGDLAQQAQAAGGLGLVYWRLGDTGKAEQYLQQSRALSAGAGETLELANAEYNLAGVMLDRGEYEGAIAEAEHALSLYDKFGHVPFAARALEMLGAAYYSRGDLARAEEFYKRAFARSRESGDLSGTALALGNLGELYTDQGKLDEAVAHYQESSRLWATLKYDFNTAFTLAGLAQARLLQAQPLTSAEQAHERLTLAEANAQESLELALKIQSPERQGIALRVLADIAGARGEHDRALAHAQQAVRALEQGGSALELRRAYRVYGRLLAASNDPDARRRGADYLEQAEKGD